MIPGYVVDHIHDREGGATAAAGRIADALEQLKRVGRGGRRQFTQGEEIFAASNGVQITLRRAE